MLEDSITQLLFYAFAVCAIIAALGVVIMRNPVSSAMCMAICFGFVAAIFFGLGAEFLGIIQITVYAGAVLVLFLFIVMMLDIKAEEKASYSWPKIILCTIVASCFALIVGKVAYTLPGASDNRPCPMVGIVKGICGDCEEKKACQPVCEKKEVLPPVQFACAKYAKLQPACPAPKSSVATRPAVSGSTLPDLKPEQKSNVSAIGAVLFTKYPIPFAILSLSLLAACVGAIAISRQLRKDS